MAASKWCSSHSGFHNGEDSPSAGEHDALAVRPPDILVAALEKSGSSPDRAIMIGDTPYDIAAARRAGPATIAFRCGGWDDAALQGSIAIYDDPKQLLDRLDQSPFYTETS
jgi:phosphoglycolate phosphatase-like HAD superfamily hydrolase